MEILYQHGKASVSEVRDLMKDAPGYSRCAPCCACSKRKVTPHRAEGLKYVYTPTVGREKAKRSAVKHLLDTFLPESPTRLWPRCWMFPPRA